VTLVGIIEEKLENVTTTFSNTYNKANDKFKSKIQMEIFVEMHARKNFWSNKTTTKLTQCKEQN
jgi:hypothetical protein